MPRENGLWVRWKRIAHVAAQVQGNVLFFVLYFVAIVPMRALGLGTRERAGPGAAPRWNARPDPSPDLDKARRQF